MNCIRLIRAFLTRFEGDHIPEIDLSQLDSREIRNFDITLIPENVTYQIKSSYMQPIWQLKKKIASAFKLKLSEFYIKTSTGALSYHFNYDSPNLFHKTTVMKIARYSQQTIEEEFPKYIFSKSKPFRDTMINLLTQKEQCAREALDLLERLPISYELREFLK